MAKLKAPFFALKATGRLGKFLTLAKRQGRHIIERRPIPTDAKSPTQLFSRLMFTKCVDLWHLLSDAERQEWESAARSRHMTGYAWYISQCLRPNPGIYLPLIGGTMQGIIDMDGFKISDLLDPVAVQDADTKAARDAAIAAAIGGSLTCDIYGWDTSNWQKLRVESAAQHNLRVALYEGATQAEIRQCALQITGAPFGLVTGALNFAFDGVNWNYIYGRTSSIDNDSAANQAIYTSAHLLGFDGTAWDRLRTYGVGVLKVGRAEIDSTTVRKEAAGAVIGGARKLFWLACSPDGPSAEWEISDDLDGLSAAVYDHFDTDKHSDHLIFDPPMKFATGIYIKKFDHMKSLTFCYI